MSQRFLLSILISSIGMVLGLFMPKLVDKIVEYKGFKDYQNSRYDLNGKEVSIYTICSILIFFLFFIAFYFYDLTEAIFLALFVIIAVAGTLVDIRIRIIPNELVLILFITGLIYTVVINGWRSLMSSLTATMLTILVFALSAIVTRKLKGAIGVGAGDIKLSMAIAFTVGFGKVYIFLFGISMAVLIYCAIGMWLKKLTIGSAFPMCGPIMFGFMVVLYWQLINFIYVQVVNYN